MFEENITPSISIVIPVYNEEDNIPVLFDELQKILNTLNQLYEIIFVDDGSKDSSFKIIEQICSHNSSVLGISLSRNFGHQIAITAGLQHAKGGVVVTMDADMQHPPELIKEMYKKYVEGYDIVNTIRGRTDDSGLFKKSTSGGFYFLIKYLTDVPIEPSSADFRLMSRRAVDAFLKFEEKDRFVRGLVSWMGFKQTFISYNSPSRYSGASKYSIMKMFRFAIDGITSFSAKPLRISFYSGLIVSLLGLVYAIYAVVEFIYGKVIPGWTSLLVSQLVIGGLILISLGIIGEYLARVFNESKNRPLYFVKQYSSKDINRRLPD